MGSRHWKTLPVGNSPGMEEKLFLAVKESISSRCVCRGVPGLWWASSLTGWGMNAPLLWGQPGSSMGPAGT